MRGGPAAVMGGPDRDAASGAREIRSALAESGRSFLAVGLFSAFVNLLMLTGPIFMLQVYDRVLSSRSEATLVALIGIVAFLFLAMGLLDHFRARVLARAGARFQARMDPRVLGAILTRAGGSPEARSAPATGLADLEAMQRFASGPGPFAFFDAPWTPIFLAVLFLFHWMLGLLAVFAGVLLLVLALVNQARTSGLQQEAGQASAQAFQLTEQMRAGGETVRGLGMRAAVRERLAAIRDRALGATIAASDRGGAFSVTTRTLRLFLQSMMLGLGAWLAIQGSITPGIMIAASILLGRALAPIDQAVAQWPVLQRALEGRRSLARLLTETPEAPVRTPLPAPDPAALKAAGQPLLAAETLYVGAPGAQRPAVRGASFALHPGSAVGIAGPSASGKSTLARALTGVWPALSGKVTLAGAEIDQYGEAALARHLGWLPQEVVLFEGTVAENIARLDPDPDADAAIEAAPTASLTIHAPASWVVVATGRQLGDPVPGPDGTRTWRWRTDVAVSAYNLVFGAAEMTVVPVGLAACGNAPASPRDDGCVEVSAWLFAEDTAQASRSFGRAADMVDFYSELIGPYPFEKLAHVQSATRFGGMENASAIFYSERRLASGSSMEGTVAHETAHQWFGAAVTARNWTELWLSEGFATYFGHLYFESRDGIGDFRRRLEASRRTYVESAVTADPIVARYDDLFEQLNPNNYPKGGWVLHMLRGIMGDDAFFGGIRTYYAQHAGTAVTTADFASDMAGAAGEDLGWFFAQWLHEPGYPVLEVEHEWDASAAEIAVTVQQVQDPAWPTFRLPLELEIVDRAGDAQRHLIELTERGHVFRLAASGPARSVRVDPDGWVLKRLVNEAPSP